MRYKSTEETRIGQFIDEYTESWIQKKILKPLALDICAVIQWTNFIFNRNKSIKEAF